jgi:general stress protein 26
MHRMSDDAVRDAIWSKVRAIETCMMVTRDGDALRSRPMTAILRTSQGAVWFIANAADHKDDDLARDPRACLAFADPHQHCYVSLSGRIAAVHDRQLVDELWNDAAARHFPAGPGDPRILLLRFEPEIGEYWVAPSGTISAVFRFLKAAVTGQTRCHGKTGRARLA